MSTPEELARQQIDVLLQQCGWLIHDYKKLDLSAGRGIAIREVRRVGRRASESFAEAQPRALIQMATGAGKTLTACAFTYRLIKHAGARNVLFLVDRANLGRQAIADWSSSDKTLSEGKARRVSAGSANQFQQFVTPDGQRARRLGQSAPTFRRATGQPPRRTKPIPRCLIKMGELYE